MRYSELVKKAANAADRNFTEAVRMLALLLNARNHPKGWKNLNFKHVPSYADGSYAIDTYYNTDKGRVPLDLSDEELDLFDEHIAPYLTYRKYKSMKGVLDPKGGFSGDFKYEKSASLAANMLAGAIIGGAVGSGTGLAQHGLAAGTGEFVPDIKEEFPGVESIARQGNARRSAISGAKKDADLYTRLGGGLTAGTLYGAGAGALYTAIEDWLTKKRGKGKQQETQE